MFITLWNIVRCIKVQNWKNIIINILHWNFPYYKSTDTKYFIQFLSSIFAKKKKKIKIIHDYKVLN